LLNDIVNIWERIKVALAVLVEIPIINTQYELYLDLLSI